jgi:hypothetical protein
MPIRLKLLPNFYEIRQMSTVETFSSMSLEKIEAAIVTGYLKA